MLGKRELRSTKPDLDSMLVACSMKLGSDRMETYWDRHHRVSNKQLLPPVKKHTSVEMPTCFNGRHTRNNLLRSLDPLPRPMFIFAIQPLLILLTQIHRTLEHPRPLQMRSIEMRMADHNSLQASFRLDELNRLVIKESNSIPEYVSGIRLDQDGALANA